MQRIVVHRGLFDELLDVPWQDVLHSCALSLSSVRGPDEIRLQLFAPVIVLGVPAHDLRVKAVREMSREQSGAGFGVRWTLGLNMSIASTADT